MWMEIRLSLVWMVVPEKYGGESHGNEVKPPPRLRPGLLLIQGGESRGFKFTDSDPKIQHFKDVYKDMLDRAGSF